MNESLSMLGPVISLVLWTHLVWFAMYATRIPAIRAAKMRLDSEARRGEQMASLPARVRWKADNYNHLLEEPTLFYAVGLSLALLGDHSTPTLVLAWTYVGLRIAHSLFQMFVNVIEVRFTLFALSSLTLMSLAARAAFAIFGS